MWLWHALDATIARVAVYFLSGPTGLNAGILRWPSGQRERRAKVRKEKSSNVLIRKSKKDPQYYEIILEVFGSFTVLASSFSPQYNQERLAEYYVVGLTDYDTVLDMANILYANLITKGNALGLVREDQAGKLSNRVVRAASDYVLKQYRLPPFDKAELS
jgi:hypothetical protein